MNRRRERKMETLYSEEELRKVLTEICDKHGIHVEVNPATYEIKSPAAVDVEHDEEGNLVGIGVYDGSYSFYFTNVSDSLRTSLLRLSIIAHNGTSDFELLH